MPNYNRMSDEELAQAKSKLSGEKDKILAEQIKIVKLLDERSAKESAKIKVDAMSEQERRAATQLLKTDSIESEEEVGEPGADS